MLQQPDVKVLKNYMKVFLGIETLIHLQMSPSVRFCCVAVSTCRFLCVCAGFLPAGQTLKLEPSSGAFQELGSRRHLQTTIKTELSIGATFALKEA